jgi:phosphoribosyl-AMP cyclohydrolase / phosphoribosyl-ATP pyrophosphohydrolase
MALTTCAARRGGTRRRGDPCEIGTASSRLRAVVTLDAAAAAPFINNIKFDKDALVPVIAQDATTGVVRMFAWATAQALQVTFTSGKATFFSRSRQALWTKGEESGNTLGVREVRLDCDGDVVLYLCDPVGPSCHTGATSCFYRAAIAAGLREDDGPPEAEAAVLARLAQVIKSRRQQTADKSYVASLLQKGFPKINAKITEEAREVGEAFVEGDKPHITHEAADVLFHLMVGLEAAEVPIEDVFAELRRRFGVGGHVEKASRG